MDYAADENGKRLRSRTLSLAEAKSRASGLSCLHCGVAVEVVSMPGSGRARSGGRPWVASPEFYFRAKRPGKHAGCPFAERTVKAVLERRVVRSLSGAPGDPPARIDLAPRQARGEASLADADDADLPVRGRYVLEGEPERQRGDRATTSNSIEPACVAYLTIDDIRRRPLVLTGAPADARTYGQVFRWWADRAPGRVAIWLATLKFTQAPDYGSRSLDLDVFDGMVRIERKGWSRRSVEGLDDELQIVMNEARRKHGGSGTTMQLRIFAYGRFDEDRDVLTVRDPRHLCVLVDFTRRSDVRRGRPPRPGAG